MKALKNTMNEDTRLALLEQSIGHINETLIRFEKRFDRLDERFDRVDERFIKIDNKIDSNFKWLLGVMIGGFTSILGIIAHLQHWI